MIVSLDVLKAHSGYADFEAEVTRAERVLAAHRLGPAARNHPRQGEPRVGVRLDLALLGGGGRRGDEQCGGIGGAQCAAEATDLPVGAIVGGASAASSSCSASSSASAWRCGRSLRHSARRTGCRRSRGRCRRRRCTRRRAAGAARRRGTARRRAGAAHVPAAGADGESAGVRHGRYRNTRALPCTCASLKCLLAIEERVARPGARVLLGRHHLKLALSEQPQVKAVRLLLVGEARQVLLLPTPPRGGAARGGRAGEGGGTPMLLRADNSTGFVGAEGQGHSRAVQAVPSQAAARRQPAEPGQLCHCRGGRARVRLRRSRAPRRSRSRATTRSASAAWAS